MERVATNVSFNTHRIPSMSTGLLLLATPSYTYICIMYVHIVYLYANKINVFRCHCGAAFVRNVLHLFRGADRASEAS
jgi:hypothetical protein